VELRLSGTQLVPGGPRGLGEDRPCLGFLGDSVTTASASVTARPVCPVAIA
jgi:hypothetical protein